MSDLSKIAARFSRAYTTNKAAKTRLATQQTKLFDAFTKELEASTLNRQLVTYNGSDTDIHEWVKTYHPGWRLVSLENGQALIEEDPSILKYTYVDPDTEVVIGRTTSSGSPSLDDDRLKDENPELWQRITTWPEPWYSLVKDTCRITLSCNWSEDALDGMAEEILQERKVERVLRDLQKVSDNDLMIIEEQYLIPAPISTRLVPPRQANADEL